MPTWQLDYDTGKLPLHLFLVAFDQVAISETTTVKQGD